MCVQEPATADGPDPADAECRLDTTSAKEVRRLIRELLDGHLEVLVHDAVIVADELISNALRHGHAPRVCRLALLEASRRLRIEVDDNGPGVPRFRTPDGTGGRGLVLVDRLATRWGVRHHPGYKTVWAELSLGTPAANRRAPQ